MFKVILEDAMQILTLWLCVHEEKKGVLMSVIELSI